MQIELLEIHDHLSRHPPFDTLPEAALQQLAQQAQVSYHKAGSPLLELGQPLNELYYIRSGAVETYKRNGDLHNRLGEGDVFGQAALLGRHKVRFAARAIEDCLLYCLPGALIEALCEEHDSLAEFLEAEGQSRLKSAVENQGQASQLMQIRLHKLLSREPVSVAPDCPVQEAAQVMVEHSVSSLLVVQEQANQPPAMLGILTDRDFRSRVLAAGLPPSTPVSAVMSAEPISLQADASVFDGMLCMLRHNIHHLPVMQRQQPLGVINLADILRYESRSSLYLVNNIFNLQSVEELQRLVPDLQATFLRMVNDQATAQMIGQAMSSIGRAFCQRLLELAEQRLGPPPVPYCFMVAGSMARDEQLLVTDQDNALVLDDRFDPALHDEYFTELARLVCNGLAACGYAYCKGGIMASNRQWRQPLHVWQGYFRQWIEHPEPRALLNSCIFFDLDAVYGQHELVAQLQEQLAEQASRTPHFLASMARNALNRTPPLGFFRTFVMEKDGRQKNIINLKGRGTAPLTDLIRVHALACGSTAQNSLARLEALAQTQWLQPQVLEQLRYAFEFLSLVRIRHQARALEAGQPPDNYIEPEHISAHERHNLKEAFQVISYAQKFLRFRYPSVPMRGL